MAARHDGFDMVAESQRKASDKYQKEHIQQITVKLNVRTDMDIIKFMWSVSNKQGLIKQLLRDEIARREGKA